MQKMDTRWFCKTQSFPRFSRSSFAWDFRSSHLFAVFMRSLGGGFLEEEKCCRRIRQSNHGRLFSRHLANFTQMMHLTLRERTQLAETNKLNQHGCYSSFIFTRPLYKYIFIFPIPARSTQLKCRVYVRASELLRWSNQENIRIPSRSPGFDS